MKLLIFLVCCSISTSVLALVNKKHYYDDLNEKITGLPELFNTKITTEPPSDFSNKFDIPSLYKYGSELNRDLEKVVESQKKLKLEIHKYSNLLEQLREQGFLGKSEFEKLSIKLKKIGEKIYYDLEREKGKHDNLSQRLVKSYTSFEMAKYFKSLKLPDNCKIEISDVNEKTLTMTVSQERGGKLTTQKGVLRFDGDNTNPGYTRYDPKRYRVETKFADLDFEAKREQTNMSILHYPDGAVELFSFQTLDKKDYLVKIPVLGLKFLERNSDPFINCMNSDDSSHNTSLDDSSRGAKKVQVDKHSTQPIVPAAAVGK